jgi:MscS family membrane protein
VLDLGTTAAALTPPTWLIDRLPAPLLELGPKGLAWWQWAGLLLLALAAWAAALPLARLTALVFARVTARTAVAWDDALVSRLPGPLRLGWWLALGSLLLPALDLGEPGAHLVDAALGTIAVLTAFWAILRSADVLGVVVAASPWARANPLSRSLLPLGLRSSKVAIVALAVVAVLSVWGFPVASLLAGLGIGGLALALAAQKTVENLFGAFSIGVDQPFREGDFVKVEDFMGTVESIGLRSTRFRTLDRTVITIPNGKLADSRTETFAPRDRIRLYANLALSYRTTAAQLRQVLAGVEGALRAHPLLSKDRPSVRFSELREWALNVEVVAWFQTTDWDTFTAVRQELLLRFLEIVEQAGAAFAFPVREVRLADGRGKGAGAPT